MVFVSETELLEAEKQLEKFKEELLQFLTIHYGKSFALDSRIKSAEKLKLKQKFLEAKHQRPIEIYQIPDIIGFRISVDDENEVRVVSDLIESFLNPNRLIDYFNNPRETGFKAKLYYFEDEDFNTEIQVMTRDMMEWTNATHEEHNKRKYENFHF